MSSLSNKQILLGITGSISAYKSAELVRLLSKTDAKVRVVLTENAKAFITPLTLQALSHFPVRDNLLDPEAENAMSHIELARWADMILIAPASANCIAKLAAGLADDLMTTLCLASSAPIALAPAMNQAMWHHPATQHNVNCLKQRGVLFFGPDKGAQACGDYGEGRLLEPTELLETLEDYFLKKSPACEAPSASPSLAKGGIIDEHIIITAGPTIEAIDPVRYISNHSSGKMGYALAEAALQAGAKVTLISGPSQLNPPAGVHYIAIRSAEEMLNAVKNCIQSASIFIGAAAVADYRCESIAPNKIKKQDSLTINLVKNPDILTYAASFRPSCYVVGFAAETDNLLENAQKKLTQKNLDMIIANPVSDPMEYTHRLSPCGVCFEERTDSDEGKYEGRMPASKKQTPHGEETSVYAQGTPSSGFHSENNMGFIITKEKMISLPLMRKTAMAEKILIAIAETKISLHTSITK